MENRDYQHAIQLGSKIHKSRKSIEFLEQCLKLKVFPHFATIPQKTIITAKVSTNRIHQLKVEIINTQILTEQTRYQQNYTKFNNVFN